jgi:hypothetical protein
MRMLVLMPGMDMLMVVFMNVLLVMMLMVGCHMAVLTRQMHIELCRMNLAAHQRTGGKLHSLPIEAKLRQSIFQYTKRYTGVQQRADSHVAADARETIEVCNLHEA